MVIDYKDYYLRTINTYEFGLKLVSGGTGLGKTRGIVSVLPDLPDDRKGIYIANRIELLRALKRDIDTHVAPNAAVMLPRDVHVVYAVFSDKDKYAELTRFISSGGLIFDKKEHREFNRVRKEIDAIVAQTNGELGNFETLLDPHARKFLRTIQSQMRIAFTTSKQKHKDWMQQPIIHALFPYIAFITRPDARILLVSLQKLFYGFFDGRRKVNGTHLKGYILFADEFDFLEKELIGLIARSRQIDDPFGFVDTFYRELNRHKWPLEAYPVADKEGGIRDRLDEIRKVIEALEKAEIDYPRIARFISTEKDRKDVAIFRTNHTVTSAPIFLYDVGRAFDIAFTRDREGSRGFYASALFQPVSAATERILTMIKELEQEDLALAEQLKQDWFRNTVFGDQIRLISQFPRAHVDITSPQGGLLASGFNMYDVYYLDSISDPDDVELKNHTIYMTPELFIREMATQNLMFALSATADIDRCVGHFDLNWLNNEGGVTVLYPDAQDRADIVDLTSQKAEGRGSQISVIQLLPLRQVQMDDPLLVNGLQSAIDTAMKFDEFGGGEDTDGQHRKQRLELFFSSVLWAAQRPDLAGEPQTHLMFLNSYRDIERFFVHRQTRQSSWHTIERIEKTTRFAVFALTLAGHTFKVVFYNAEKARQVRLTEAATQEFQGLFYGTEPVLMVTQYLSAGNGVNPQYSLLDGRERDFLNLHLLEVPYFYFDGLSLDDTPETTAAKIKTNIWYIAKLHEAKYFSQKEFKVKLGTIHQPSTWNSEYQHHPRTSLDYQRNTIAALIQALGRIERVWKPMPDQHLVLSTEAYFAFERFLSAENESIRDARQELSSINLQQVLAQIGERQSQKKRSARRKADPAVKRHNELCKQKMQILINAFSAIRQGQNKPARWTWEHLREAALRHDFADEILNKYSGIFESRFITDARVYLSEEGDVIPPSEQDGTTPVWSLNSVYRPVKNTVIATHFTKAGYELRFNPTRTTAFVPYFHQAILMGALGEESVRALLRAQGVAFEPISDALFEVADLKIKGVNWYLDCKNYSDNTMGKFELMPDDYGYFTGFDSTHFKSRAVDKWRSIDASHGESSTGNRLIYLNLATSQTRLADYYQVQGHTLKRVHAFRDAHILIIPGAIDLSAPDTYHHTFTRLLSEMGDIL